MVYVTVDWFATPALSVTWKVTGKTPEREGVPVTFPAASIIIPGGESQRRCQRNKGGAAGGGDGAGIVDADDSCVRGRRGDRNDGIAAMNIENTARNRRAGTESTTLMAKV